MHLVGVGKDWLIGAAQHIILRVNFVLVTSGYVSLVKSCQCNCCFFISMVSQICLAQNFKKLVRGEREEPYSGWKDIKLGLYDNASSLVQIVS